MAAVVRVRGMDECVPAITDAQKKGGRVFVFCTGADDASGTSWCPDCVRAKPVVNEAMEKFSNENDVFIICDVGDRPTWKDPNNVFRQDPKFRIKSVPTLLVWDTPMRLVEGECADARKLELLFED
eukprot:m.107056 g.107056  ORF g.107056 m.107056 type:complete len:126 (+) comp15172_c0_seq2:218-595(+)